MISGAFFRGTTPTHTFTLPFEMDMISDIRITYLQNQKEVFVKGMEDIEISDNEVSLTFTQEETYQFQASEEVLVQIKIKTTEGIVLNSDIMRMRVDASLNNEVI